MIQTFRDRIRGRVPWLQRGTAERFLYAIGLHVDVFGDTLNAALKQRFPGLYSYDSLEILGRERRIIRGRFETNAGYAARLRRWLVDHRSRGGPYALLGQLLAHYTPASFPIDLVYYSGRRFFMDAGGAITGSLSAWTPDSNAAKWARWWLFFYTDQWSADDPTDDELEDLRLVPRQWNAAHPNGTIILYPTGSELWNYPPGHTWNESGTWNTSGHPILIDVEAN
jgi:hypothetical protein